MKVTWQDREITNPILKILVMILIYACVFAAFTGLFLAGIIYTICYICGGHPNFPIIWMISVPLTWIFGVKTSKK